MAEKPMCCKHVYKRGRSHPCARPARIEHDGKLYCGIHDPQKREDRAARWEAKFDAEAKARERTQRIREAERAVIEAAKRFAPALLRWMEDEDVDSGPIQRAFTTAVQRLRKAEGNGDTDA